MKSKNENSLSRLLHIGRLQSQIVIIFYERTCHNCSVTLNKLFQLMKSWLPHLQNRNLADAIDTCSYPHTSIKVSFCKPLSVSHYLAFSSHRNVLGPMQDKPEVLASQCSQQSQPITNRSQWIDTPSSSLITGV